MSVSGTDVGAVSQRSWDTQVLEKSCRASSGAAPKTPLGAVQTGAPSLRFNQNHREQRPPQTLCAFATVLSKRYPPYLALLLAVLGIDRHYSHRSRLWTREEMSPAWFRLSHWTDLVILPTPQRIVRCRHSVTEGCPHRASVCGLQPSDLPAGTGRPVMFVLQAQPCLKGLRLERPSGDQKNKRCRNCQLFELDYERVIGTEPAVGAPSNRGNVGVTKFPSCPVAEIIIYIYGRNAHFSNRKVEKVE